MTSPADPAPPDRMMRLYGRVIPRFRRRRMRLFAEVFRPDSGTRVLDVGGTPVNWQLLDAAPQVTLLNLTSGDVVGDGTKLPFRDASFDIVFSNSTIEHVGGGAKQEAFAREIARVGKSYFVQTPNRYFPIEPHYMTPLVQFLPRRALRRVVRNFTVWGLLVRPGPDAVEERTTSTWLLSETDMARLFPGGEIRRERLCGLTKALVALRRTPASRGHPPSASA